VGVEPVNTKSAAQDANALRQLVEHSEGTGALDIVYATRVSTALRMQSTPIRVLVRHEDIIKVPENATVADVREATHASGHHRILVGNDQRLIGMVHVRDTLALAKDDQITQLIRPILEVDADLSIHEALAAMRRSSTHLAVVRNDDGVNGLVTMNDVISGLITRESSGDLGVSP
jgi:CBS domain containing-hemolysin-like protein